MKRGEGEGRAAASGPGSGVCAKSRFWSYSESGEPVGGAWFGLLPMVHALQCRLVGRTTATVGSRTDSAPVRLR